MRRCTSVRMPGYAGIRRGVTEKVTMISCQAGATMSILPHFS